MFWGVKPRRKRGGHRCVTSTFVEFGKLIRNGTTKVGELCDDLFLLIVTLEKNVSWLQITMIDLIPVFLGENVIIWLRTVMGISQGVHAADEPLPNSSFGHMLLLKDYSANHILQVSSVAELHVYTGLARLLVQEMVDHFHDIFMILKLIHQRYFLRGIVFVWHMPLRESFFDEKPVNGIIF
jgi:hypothetical protein